MTDIETLELFDGREPFPGHDSLFLAMLNARMEDASPGERKEYLAVRYEIGEFRSKEREIGKDAVSGRKVKVATSHCEYECSFVHRKTRSDAKTGIYRHEVILKIERESRRSEADGEFEIC